MRHHPLLMSGPMVKALLAGKKSMTRRVVSLGKNCHFGATGTGKFHDYDWSRAEVRNHSMLELISLGKTKLPMLHVPFSHKGDGWEENPEDDTVDRLYPIYQVGDVLWVRETWCRKWDHEQDGFAYNADDNLDPSCCYYRADGDEPEPVDGDGFRRYRKNGEQASPWVPAIHMPRWACRLELTVTAVRVERLQDISVSDVLAEGITCPLCGYTIRDAWEHMDHAICIQKGGHPNALDKFRELWDGLNSKRGYSWESNPFVIVLTFAVAPERALSAGAGNEMGEGRE